MRRREFMTGLGATACPLTAHAQQGSPRPYIIPLAPEKDDSREQEVREVWKAVVQQADSLNAQLASVVTRTRDEAARGLTGKIVGLIFDRGHLRPINDTDATLEPNHYMTIIYTKDFSNQKWSISALDNRNEKTKIGEISNEAEIQYFYHRSFERGYIAKMAKAYVAGKLIASAEATMKITSASPYQILVHETQYDANGSPVYAGDIAISLGSRGGIAKETAYSGKKVIAVFNSWGTGSL
jgi:hypothetical protein